MADSTLKEASFLPLASAENLWGATAKSAKVLERNPRRVAVDLVRLFIANGTPVTLWGPVGARKTRTIEALARERDENGTPYQVITLQPSTQDPTIIHGMMYTSREGDSTVMRRSIPHVAEQVIKYAQDSDGLTILFADEMTTCLPAQQNAMLGLLTHGKFEDIDISQHIAIVMAANPEGTVSTVIPLNEAVMNRGGHIAWYGDSKLFLEEWSTGFDGATDIPDEATVRLIKSMFKQSPEKVFRSEKKKWTTEELVPWDMMEHTERAVTETARLIEMVSRVLKDVEPEISQHYMVEVTRALLGNHWADVAKIALDQQSDGISKQAVLEWVREASASDRALDSEDADFKALVEKYGSPWSDDLRHDQATELLSDLIGKSYADGTFSYDNYYGAWALISAAPSDGERAALTSQAVELFHLGRSAFKDEKIKKEQVVPRFVPRTVQRIVRQAINEPKEKE